MGRFLQEDSWPIASGSTQYFTYASSNPVNVVDPLGLFDFEADVLSYLPSNAAIGNFSAGLGDALLFGYGDDLREAYDLAFGTTGSSSIDRCSTAYVVGDWASLAVGSSRIAYAGAAKGTRLLRFLGNTERLARIANSARSILKFSFRLGLSRKGILAWGDAVRRYGASWETIIEKASTTNFDWNLVGVWAAAGAVANEECACQR
jgi:hypothetical protein